MLVLFGLRKKIIFDQTPIEKRVRVHILVCFLAYVLWKTLGRLCLQAGLGDEPRKLFQELSQIKLTDVILPTRNSKEIKLRCVETPSRHQGILCND